MTTVDTAMILAAGFGKRLRPLTETTPKPLVPMHGRALIDHVIDRLVAVGIRRVVINLHYKAEVIEEHLASRRDVEMKFSREDDILETGGGVKQALPLLGESFFVVNSDIIWLDGKVPALERLRRSWNPERFDALLLMQRTTTAIGYDGPGDFIVDPNGAIRRRAEREVAPQLFSGIEIMHRRLFDDAPEGRFSLNLLWDKAILSHRIAAIVHDGEWYLVDTPAGLAATEERFNSHRVER